MKKWAPIFLVTFVSVLAGCCVHNSVRHPGERSTLIDELKSDTVALVHRDSDDDVVPFCTGVWIDKDTIVTADHCARVPVEEVVEETATGDETDEVLEARVQKLEDGFEINYIVDSETQGIYREPKKMHVAKVVKHNRTHDIAVLKVKDVKDTPTHHVARLAVSTPQVGEELHCVGHVIGMYYTYVPGTVAAYREENFLPFRNSGVLGPWLQVSGPIYKGNSGGGCFTSNGDLVGIASRLIPAPNAAMYVHLDTIKTFLGKR